MGLTNQQFGDRIGCTHSMASRIRNGKRLPGPNLIEAISQEYGIPMKALMEARRKGEAAMGRLVRTRIFDPVVKAEKEAAKKAAADARAKRKAA